MPAAAPAAAASDAPDAAEDDGQSLEDLMKQMKGL
jgi:hypothetical protein